MISQELDNICSVVFILKFLTVCYQTNLYEVVGITISGRLYCIASIEKVVVLFARLVAQPTSPLS